MSSVDRTSANVPFSASLPAFIASAFVLAVSLFVSAPGYLNDDSVISYRAAWRLAAGDGLVTWPGGPPEEGFSNPLTVLLSGAGAWLSGTPSLETAVRSGMMVNYLAAAGLLLMLSYMGRRSGGAWSGWLTPLLMAAAYPLAWYVHSGLETPLYAFWLTALVFALIAGRIPLAALAGLGAAMTRTEGILVVGAVWLAALPIACAKVSDHEAIVGLPRSRFRSFALWFCVVFAVYALFTAGRVLVFGHLLPSPLIVKSGLAESRALGGRGFDYLLRNYQSYPLYALVTILAALEIFGKSRFCRYLPASTLLIVQLIFILAVGGDEIHLGASRFILPVLPVAIWCAASALSRLGSRQRTDAGTQSSARWVAVAATLALAITSQANFNTMAGQWHVRNTGFFARLLRDPGETMRRQLNRWMTPVPWIDAEAGRFMAELVGEAGKGLSMASVQAGSLPVYWEGEFIDLMGLTTRRYALARNIREKDLEFERDLPDIVMAYRWQGGWFPYPSVEALQRLGYRPMVVIQLIETIETGNKDENFTINFLALVRDTKILKNVSRIDWDGMVDITYSDEVNEMAGRAMLKRIEIHRGIIGE